MAPTAFGDAAMRDWLPALQHISGRGGMRWVLGDLILCSPGWCLQVAGRPSVVLGGGGGETWDSGAPEISPSNPHLPVCKNWGPFPQNDYPERTGDTAIHPQLSGTSMLSVGQDHQQGIPVGSAHFHHCLQGQCPCRAELTRGLAPAHGGC